MNVNILFSGIKNTIEYQNFIKKFEELYKSNNILPFSLNGINEGAENALLYLMVSDLKKLTGKTAIIVTPEQREANKINEFFKKAGIYSEFFPIRDYNFYEMTSSREEEQERIRILFELVYKQLDVVVTTPESLIQYTIPKEKLINNSFYIEKTTKISIEDFAKKLLFSGYRRADLVESPGQFAIRGGIIDVFPISSNEQRESYPVRIELFGDEIDRIAKFDIFTQRSTENIENFEITPSKELIPTKENLDEIKRLLNRLLKSKNISYDTQKEIEKEILAIDTNIATSFLDRFISVIYPENETLYDYFDDNSPLIIISQTKVKQKGKDYISGIKEASISLENSKIIEKSYNNYCLNDKQFGEIINSDKSIYIDNFTRVVSREWGGLYNFKVKSIEKNDNFHLMLKDIENLISLNYSCVIVCRTETEQRSIIKTLSDYNIPANAPETDSEEFLIKGGVSVLVDYITDGYDVPSQKTAVFVLSYRTEIKTKKKKRSRYEKDSGDKFLTYSDINVGDYVVHYNYGIGKYLGINSLYTNGSCRDYITIQFQGTDKLFLPVDQLDMISKYIGPSSSDGEVKLSKMGGLEWKKATTKAKASAKEMAKDLIELYATRIRTPGYAFSKDGLIEHEFDTSFEYEETDSQIDAINDVKEDMEKPYPMERVICGDVGYGKTEVAFRAAMKAVANNKQVAILVPTTILAMQHYQTAIARFAGTGVNIDYISRFRTQKEQSSIFRKLRRGDLDIIIGTHKLLNNEIEFKDLGLLVIDEEQRFGVVQKEKIKKKAPCVDVLMLSATPIPRTLSMAMGGIRDMSVLDDAPAGRLAVNTYVLEFNETIINDAIRRELHRGGQVFYLFNKIDEIYRVANRLGDEFPGARIRVAHGQLSPDEIEGIWQDLVDGEIDILVCTTIIETGIDIPNANTLIIEDADKMGLAQLHQIRGRVGRSFRKSYAYFTFRTGKLVSEIAEKRLNAIRDFAEFGAGFKIAMKDLEIRGAGNILGAAQHGHLESIGYDMYIKLLNEAVLEEKGEIVQEKKETTVTISYDAYIPEKYILSSIQRMEMYKKIAHIQNEDDQKDIKQELTDRYGKIPNSVNNLTSVSLLKSYSQRAGITKIEILRGEVRFYPESVNIAALFESLKSNKDNIKFYSLGKRSYISCNKIDFEKDITPCLMFVKNYLENLSIDSGKI